MTDIANFSIFTRNLDGILQQHAPNTEEYTYVAHAIYTALKILTTPQARQCLVELTLLFDFRVFKDTSFYRDHRRAGSAVNTFLEKISERFPPVVIDETLTHPDVYGNHLRGPWSGPLENFQPRGQMILINARKVHDMITVSQTNGAVFRQFLFLFSTTLVHEVGGHLLITYLGHGRIGTPTEMSVAGYSQDIRLGESGRYLEQHLFGGTLEYLKEPNQIMHHHTGIPHIVDKHGTTWKLEASAIEGLVSGNITLPLQKAKKPVNHEMKSMGHGIPFPGGYLNARPMMAGRMSETRIRQMLNGFNVRLRDIRMVPSNPRRLLRAC